MENNLNVEKKLIFPDHYDFTKKEIQTIVDEAKINGYQVITTEKNYIKIKNFKIDGFDYLKVTLDIYDKNKFIKTIKKFYDKKN